MAKSWQFSRSVIECNRYMLEHSIQTDVTFVVCHKLHTSTAAGGSGPNREPDCRDSREIETRTDIPRSQVSALKHRMFVLNDLGLLY